MAKFSFYNTPQWKKLRKYIINRANGICEYCDGTCGEKANIAHHKIFVTPENVGDPSVVWNPDNLIAVSQTCHNKIHHSDGQGCTREGLTFDSQGNLIKIDDSNVD